MGAVSTFNAAEGIDDQVEVDRKFGGLKSVLTNLLGGREVWAGEGVGDVIELSHIGAMEMGKYITSYGLDLHCFLTSFPWDAVIRIRRRKGVLTKVP